MKGSGGTRPQSVRTGQSVNHVSGIRCKPCDRNAPVGHSPGAATGAKTTPLATEGHQFLVMTGVAADSEKAMLEPAALQVLVEFPGDVCR